MAEALRRKLVNVKPEEVLPGKNVRLDDRRLGVLAGDLKRHGMLQPITIVPTADGEGVECLFGHRRRSAAILAGLATIPAFIQDRTEEVDRILRQFAENEHREPMTKLEEALIFAELRDSGMSQQLIAESVGLSQPGVSDRLLLLNYPEPIRMAVHHRRLGLTDAIAIPLALAKATPAAKLTSICRGGGSSVRAWVRKEVAEHAARGEKITKRVTYHSMNVDADLMDEVRAGADRLNVTVIEFVRRAVRTFLEGLEDD